MSTTSIDQDISEFRGKVKAFQEANPGALYMGTQNVCCVKLGCAGVTLLSSLIAGRKNQKNFSGLMGERFTRMTKEEIAELRVNLQRVADTYGDGTYNGLCECGAVK